MFNKKVIKAAVSIVTSSLSFYISYALADGGTTDIGTVASTITNTLSSVLKLVTAGAYVAGFGLTVASLFKFKQHKENPQQAPLGTCVAMLIIGISLIFLPSIISVGGGTLGASNQGSVGGWTS
jgi:intracellular multiplication protein IcmD